MLSGNTYIKVLTSQYAYSLDKKLSDGSSIEENSPYRQSYAPDSYVKGRHCHRQNPWSVLRRGGCCRSKSSFHLFLNKMTLLWEKGVKTSAANSTFANVTSKTARQGGKQNGNASNQSSGLMKALASAVPEDESPFKATVSSGAFDCKGILLPRQLKIPARLAII